MKYLNTENPDARAKKYLEQLQKTELEKLTIQKEEVLGETVIVRCKAERITTDGNQIGYFMLCTHSNETSDTPKMSDYYIEYQPFVNEINGEGFHYSLSDVTEVSSYRYMFQNRGIICQVNSKEEFIVIFEDKETAEDVLARLQDFCPNSIDKLKADIDRYQKMWINGWMSNFDYLMLLNKLAGRSFIDLAQYPIMPWVLKQYSASSLDYDNTRIYRDLEKPIGALNDEKLDKFKAKYQEVLNDNTDEKPYMYFTHYSTSGIVLYYLIRNIPSHILKLQNGGFGPIDRIFFDIEMSWNN